MDCSISTQFKSKSYLNQNAFCACTAAVYGNQCISCAQTNTFQCIWATDNVQSYVIFQYADGLIQWTTGDTAGGVGGLGGTPAQVGFNAGDNVNYANVPGSRTPAIINITSTSNDLVPGQWIFSVRNAIISAGMARCKN